MAILSWGKPTIEISPLTGGVVGAWSEIYTPVMGTSTLETTEGDVTTAQIEGGEVIDSRREANSATFTFNLHRKTNDVKPIEDKNGVVVQEYALRLTPEDPTTEGFIINRAKVSVIETWTAADGYQWQYTFAAVKPLDDDKLLVEPYLAPAE